MLRILKSLWRISEEKVSFKVYVIINWLKDGLNIDLFTLSELKNVKVINLLNQHKYRSFDNS